MQNKKEGNHAKLVVALHHLPRLSAVLEPSATSLDDSVARRGERAGLHLVPIYSSRRAHSLCSSPVFDAAWWVPDKQLQPRHRSGCPFCVGKRADIDISCPTSTSAARLPVFLPGGVRSGQVRGKSQPSHTDQIALTHRRRKNKKFDSVKVAVRGSTVLAGYRSDMALSEGIKELTKPVYVTLKSLLSVHSVPREGERDVCVIRLPSHFLLFFLFSLKHRGTRKKKLSHSGRRSTLLGECFPN